MLWSGYSWRQGRWQGTFSSRQKTEEQPKTTEQTQTTTQVKVQAAQVHNFVRRFDDKFLINIALKRNDAETKEMLFLSNSPGYVSYSIPAALFIGGIVRHGSRLQLNRFGIADSSSNLFNQTILFLLWLYIPFQWE